MNARAPLADRLLGILSDGQRHGLRSLAARTGASPGDVLACLTALWESGAAIDADEYDGRADHLWWSTDVPADVGLLQAVRLHTDGASIGSLAYIIRTTVNTARRRVRLAVKAGHIETSGRTVSTRYHITAAGLAALESQ